VKLFALVEKSRRSEERKETRCLLSLGKNNESHRGLSSPAAASAADERASAGRGRRAAGRGDAARGHAWPPAWGKVVGAADAGGVGAMGEQPRGERKKRGWVTNIKKF
jgi:hypothetical protein